MGIWQRLKSWSDERSPLARARREEDERRALIAALPIPVAHRVVKRLMDREIASDPEAPEYSLDLCHALEGLLFEDVLEIRRGPLNDHDVPEPSEDDAVVVGIDRGRAIFVRVGSPVVHALSVREPIAPSLAHLILDAVLRLDDARALTRDPMSWVPNPSHRHNMHFYPPPKLGPEAFALDERPRRWALVGSVVVLPVSILLVLFGGYALREVACSGLLALGLGCFGVWHSVRRLEEVLLLEPRLRAMAPSEEGFLDGGRRRAWSEVIEHHPGPSRSTLVLADGRKLVLPYAGFLDGPSAAAAIDRARAQGAPRYRG